MSNRFEWDDTHSSGIWWSTNVSIRDECILLKDCLLYTSDAADGTHV